MTTVDFHQVSHHSTRPFHSRFMAWLSSKTYVLILCAPSPSQSAINLRPPDGKSGKMRYAIPSRGFPTSAEIPLTNLSIVPISHPFPTRPATEPIPTATLPSA